MRVKLTDRFVAGARTTGVVQADFFDEGTPGLSLRVSSTGAKTWTFLFTSPRDGRRARLAFGGYPAISLADARGRARQARGYLAEQPPRDPRDAFRDLAACQGHVLLEAVADDFIREKLAQERKGQEVARDLRRDVLPKLGKRPIAEIGRVEIREIIKAKKVTAPAQARNLLGYCKRFFSWALDQEVYGLKASPCTDIKAREIIGERASRDRTLDDDEIFALWRAAMKESYPYRQIYQLLALNGLRLNEAADASRPEFDFRKRDWIIPADRMKGRNGKARPHLVPLTNESLKILGGLPVLTEGPYLFSCDFGKSPVWVGSKIKNRIDARMRLTLKAFARKRGEDPGNVELKHWVNHDIRRTVRSNLSPLKNAQGIRISDEVKEAVIAHARPGIKGVYDRYEYADEKFEALTLWAAQLWRVVGNAARNESPVQSPPFLLVAAE